MRLSLLLVRVVGWGGGVVGVDGVRGVRASVWRAGWGDHGGGMADSLSAHPPGQARPSSPRRWRLLAPFLAVVLVSLLAGALAPLPGLAPATAAQVPAQVPVEAGAGEFWERDEASGLVSYRQVVRAGGPPVCRSQSCRVVIEAGAPNLDSAVPGDPERDDGLRVAATLGSFYTSWRTSWPAEHTITTTNARALAEVTAIRAVTYLRYGGPDPVEVGTWQGVAAPAPGPAVSLTVHEVDRGELTGALAYDIEASATSITHSGGPCPGRSCWWLVQLGHTRPDGTWRAVTLDGAYTSSWTRTSGYSTDPDGPDGDGVHQARSDLTNITHARLLIADPHHPDSATFTDPDYEPGPGDADVVVSTGWQQITNPPGPPSTRVRVQVWDRDPDHDPTTSGVDYNLDVDLRHLGSTSSPCYGSACTYSVEFGHQDDGGNDWVIDTTAIAPTTLLFPWLYRDLSATDAPGLAQVTHVRVRTWPAGDPDAEFGSGWQRLPGLVVDDLHLSSLAAAMLALPRHQWCQPLVFYPANTDTDSLPEPYKACTLSVDSGAPLRAVLQAVIRSGGTHALDLMSTDHDPHGPGPLHGGAAEFSHTPDDDSDGTSDTGPTPEPEPEPQPAGAGAGIPLPPRCLDQATYDRLLLEAAGGNPNNPKEQVHHLATNKFRKKFPFWTEVFEAIVVQNGLDLHEPRQQANHWNKIAIPHKGNHPYQYHDWVWRNMQKIHQELTAEGLTGAERAEEFAARFEARVKAPIAADPVAVQHDWWECQPYGTGT